MKYIANTIQMVLLIIVLVSFDNGYISPAAPQEHKWMHLKINLSKIKFSMLKHNGSEIFTMDRI